MFTNRILTGLTSAVALVLVSAAPASALFTGEGVWENLPKDTGSGYVNETDVTFTFTSANTDLSAITIYPAQVNTDFWWTALVDDQIPTQDHLGVIDPNGRCIETGTSADLGFAVTPTSVSAGFYCGITTHSAVAGFYLSPVEDFGTATAPYPAFPTDEMTMTIDPGSIESFLVNCNPQCESEIGYNFVYANGGGSGTNGLTGFTRVDVDSGSSGGSNGSGSLATTGSDVMPLVMFSITSIALAGVVAVYRRRAHNH